MGAEFIYSILPGCKITPERFAAATALIKAFNVDESDLDCGDPDHDAMLAAFVSYADGGFGGSRDVGELHLGGASYYLTGGMSYGDAPTDAYDQMNALICIYDQLETWSREDVGGVVPEPQDKGSAT